MILSGTGSDGTLGMEEIKAEGGITLRRTSHPRSTRACPRARPGAAASISCCRPIRSPANWSGLASTLTSPRKRPPRRRGQPLTRSQLQENPRHVAVGVPCRLQRLSRDDRQAADHAPHGAEHQGKLRGVAEQLKKDHAEVEALYQDILINVTSFFREPETFEALKERFPAILRQEPGDADPHLGARLFHGPGSLLAGHRASGIPRAQPVRPPIQIFATDLSENTSLVKARVGVYPNNIEAEVSPERLRRFFSKEQAAYRINKSVRDLCVFARQNVVADPPFSHLDLISCRNVLIYLTPLQKRVIPTFHFALNPTGFLLLGASETVGSFAQHVRRWWTRSPTSSPRRRRGSGNIPTSTSGDASTEGVRRLTDIAAAHREGGLAEVRPTAPCWGSTPLPACWSTTTWTSSSSAARPVDTWRLPPESRASTSSRWPARACCWNFVKS